MTYFVGVDIAKYTHYASVIDSYGEILKEPFAFENTASGFNSLIETLNSLESKGIVIGFESTAHYHENLYNFLSKKGYQCILINPILTKRFRGLNIRDCKNDKVDSLSIASFVSFSYNSKKLSVSQEFQINELKTLSLERERIKSNLSTEKIRLTAALDRVFPELKKYIGNTLYSKSFLNFLKKYNTAEQIKTTRIDALYNKVNEKRSILTQEEVNDLKSLAKISVGFHSEAISNSIIICVNQIELLIEQKKHIDNMIISNMTELGSPILKISGMGYIQTAYILSALVNISRFDSPSKILAYAGLDPKVRESGLFKAKTTRMSKRGNKLLRYALIWSANNVRKNSKSMQEYYLKKRAEGKNHYNALGHCAKKLTNYIFFVLNNPDVEFKLD